jgi:hypothetical protein
MNLAIAKEFFDMSMPRFTAEASLYRTSEPYRTTQTLALSHGGSIVLPQMIFGWEWGFGSLLFSPALGQLDFRPQPVLQLRPLLPLRSSGGSPPAGRDMNHLGVARSSTR